MRFWSPGRRQLLALRANGNQMKVARARHAPDNFDRGSGFDWQAVSSLKQRPDFGVGPCTLSLRPY